MKEIVDTERTYVSMLQTVLEVHEMHGHTLSNYLAGFHRATQRPQKQASDQCRREEGNLL